MTTEMLVEIVVISDMTVSTELVEPVATSPVTETSPVIADTIVMVNSLDMEVAEDIEGWLRLVTG